MRGQDAVILVGAFCSALETLLMGAVSVARLLGVFSDASFLATNVLSFLVFYSHHVSTGLTMILFNRHLRAELRTFVGMKG